MTSSDPYEVDPELLRVLRDRSSRKGAFLPINSDSDEDSDWGDEGGLLSENGDFMKVYVHPFRALAHMMVVLVSYLMQNFGYWSTPWQHALCADFYGSQFAIIIVEIGIFPYIRRYFDDVVHLDILQYGAIFSLSVLATLTSLTLTFGMLNGHLTFDEYLHVDRLCVAAVTAFLNLWRTLEYMWVWPRVRANKFTLQNARMSPLPKTSQFLKNPYWDAERDGEAGDKDGRVYAFGTAGAVKVGCKMCRLEKAGAFVGGNTMARIPNHRLCDDHRTLKHAQQLHTQ